MQPCAPLEWRRRRTQRVALGVLLGFTFLVVAWMAAPLVVGLALGTVMAFTAQPLYVRLTARLGQRRALASALTTLSAGVVTVGGGAALIWVVVQKLGAAVSSMRQHIAAGDSALFGPKSARVLSALNLDRAAIDARIREQLGRAADLAAHAAGVLVQTSAGVLLTIVVSLWTTYYVLLDWSRLGHHLERLLPLDPDHTRALADEFRAVGRRAFVGALAGAVIQGTTAGVGFALCGVPEPATWAAALALTSFIPVIGVLLVWVPAALWLLFEGHIVYTVLLVAWSLVVVMALNDYLIKPYLVGGRGEGHPLLMFVALIGGISVFGVAGLIVGPIIAALFLASARIYERERDDGDSFTSDGASSSEAPTRRRRRRLQRAPLRSRSSTIRWSRQRPSQLRAVAFAEPTGARALQRRSGSEDGPMRKLIGKRIAILVCDGFEYVELTQPRTALEDEGADTEIVSPEAKRVRSWKQTDWGRSFKVDVPLEQADAQRYDALLLPGGVMNPDNLRLHRKAIDFVRAFAHAGKPIAAICHGAWPLIDADWVRGKTVTSWPSLAVDLRNAGANWVDQEVAVDGKLVTSRKPEDIPAFTRAMVDCFVAHAVPRAHGAGRDEARARA